MNEKGEEEVKRAQSFPTYRGLLPSTHISRTLTRTLLSSSSRSSLRTGDRLADRLSKGNLTFERVV